MNVQLLESFNNRLKEIIGVSSLTQEAREEAWGKLIQQESTLIVEFTNGQETSSSIALHDYEIAPLVSYHYTRCYESVPLLKRKKVSIELQKLTPALTKDPSANVVPNKYWRQRNILLKELWYRIQHLSSEDISKATSWVWHGKYPYPTIDGKIRFLLRKSESFISEQDVWTSVPIPKNEFVDIQDDIAFALPQRLSLTMPSGGFRPFEVNTGFVGTDEFDWLKAHSNSQNVGLSYEGVVKDVNGIVSKQSLQKNRAKPGKNFQIINLQVAELSRAYGLTKNTNGVVELKEGKLKLVCGSSTSVNRGRNVFAIVDRSVKGQSNYQITTDGSKAHGPQFKYIKFRNWGFNVRTADCELSATKWHVFCYSAFEFSEFSFLREPEECPFDKCLVGQKLNSAWGAISSKDGSAIIPFEYNNAFIYRSGHVCMIFSDNSNQHVVFDEQGQKKIGPLHSFEHPNELCSTNELHWPNYKSEDDRLREYIRRDLPLMFASAKAAQWVRDFDSEAPDLSWYSNKFMEGHKDAIRVGIWRKQVEVVSEIQIGKKTISVGQVGTIEEDLSFRPNRHSNLDWQSNLPVVGLVSTDPYEVLHIPFGHLRLVTTASE